MKRTLAESRAAGVNDQSRPWRPCVADITDILKIVRPAPDDERFSSGLPSHPVELHRGIDRFACGHRHAELMAERHHLAGEPVELEPVAGFEIVEHRRLHAGRGVVGKRYAVVHPGAWHLGAGFLTDGETFLH